MCHTKSTLRLPLNVYSAAVVKDIALPTPADEQIDSSKTSSNQDFSETSCTGSMDSINSFDGSKNMQNHLNHNSTNADGLSINEMKKNSTDSSTITTEANDINFHENQPVHNDVININSNKMKCDLRSTANRQSDSTDEDSGIENIRIAKEI